MVVTAINLQLPQKDGKENEEMRQKSTEKILILATKWNPRFEISKEVTVRCLTSSLFKFQVLSGQRINNFSVPCPAGTRHAHKSTCQASVSNRRGQEGSGPTTFATTKKVRFYYFNFLNSKQLLL